MKRMSGVIGPVQHLPGRVAAYLAREISTGRLSPGERLPTEHQLAEQLGVSRNVVREAISQLRADGMIQSRQGVGAFVLTPEQRRAVRFDPHDLEDRDHMAQLFELRGILETEAAGLAAQRCSDDDLERIKQALDRMAGEERWEDGSIDADLDFHREIARATGNELIHTFICFVVEQIRQSIYVARALHPLRELIEINLAEHVEIYDALKARNAAHARERMHYHVMQAGERVFVGDTAHNTGTSAR